MPVFSMACESPRQKWSCRVLAGLLILGAAGLHLVYLSYQCPLDLAPDEAHYWDWSRHLDWSYYSKGPLVAYLIRAGCALAGSWSQPFVGSEMLAVRLPAIICSSLLLLSLYILTIQVFRREQLALAVVALSLTLPAVAAGATLTTIDAPYTCCWGWALVLGHRAVSHNSTWVWAATGLIVGIGILAKYTMVIWLPSLALYLLGVPVCRHLLFQRGFWIMTVVAACSCVPILVWNVQHDWVSLHHVSGQAGLREDRGIFWLGPLAYLGMQCALLLGFWFVAWTWAMIAHRPTKETDPGICYLWWMSATMFTVFLGFSLKTREEPNWPVTAYLSGVVLTTGWLSQQLRDPRLWFRRLTSSCLATASALGLAVIILMHRSDWVQPILQRVSGPATTEQPLPLRRFDPTCRLRGWRFLAAEVDQLRFELQTKGDEPLLAASSWTIPGELGFYCRGNPQVFSLGLPLGDRHSQYDLWEPNPVKNPEHFLGRTFVYVGVVPPLLRQAFDHVEAPHTVVYRERANSIAQWTVSVCRGFRGFHSRPQELDGRPY